jgi:hypothetical protein
MVPHLKEHWNTCGQGHKNSQQYDDIHTRYPVCSVRPVDALVRPDLPHLAARKSRAGRFHKQGLTDLCGKGDHSTIEGVCCRENMPRGMARRAAAAAFAPQ